jgi:hypothetical protein
MPNALNCRPKYAWAVMERWRSVIDVVQLVGGMVLFAAVIASINDRRRAVQIRSRVVLHRDLGDDVTAGAAGLIALSRLRPVPDVE